MKKTNLSYSFEILISESEELMTPENKEIYFRKSCQDIIQNMAIEDLKKFFKNVEAVPEVSDCDIVGQEAIPTHAIYRFNTSIEIPD